MGKTDNDEAYEKGVKDGKEGGLLDDFVMGNFYDVLPPHDQKSEIYKKGYEYGADHRYDTGGSDSGSSSGSGCFLTTACIQWAGLPDNCAALEEFRHFRDGYMMEEDDRAELVKQYYYLSPLIVSKIEKDPNKNEILKQLYSEGILPAFSRIKEGDFKSAMILYSIWTRRLAKRYGVLTN